MNVRNWCASGWSRLSSALYMGSKTARIRIGCDHRTCLPLASLRIARLGRGHDHPCYRRGRLHRLQRRHGPAWRAASASSASTTSTIITTRRSSRRGSPRCAAAHGNAFAFEQVDFGDQQALEAFAARHQFDRIVHLGAQAGVGYSLVNPQAYVRSNLIGQVNMLELARARGRSSISSMPARRRSMAATRRCRSASRTASTIRSRSTPRPRRPTS